MTPFIHDHVAHCMRCQDPFYYDATLSVAAPRVCPQCKLSRRAATEGARKQKSVEATQAQLARRRQQAEILGFSSSSMGKHLKELTIRSHAEVAAILGISLEASRLLERSALAKCRKAFKSHLLAQQIDNSLRDE